MPEPRRVVFVVTEMVVGGAETLLAEILRCLDRTRFSPELVCLKSPATLGEQLARELPVHANLLASKYDLGVLGRLTRLLRNPTPATAVVTVGTGGDRMFWGRLAGWRAGVPVILSSLHSTGYPVVVERLNRWLHPLSDGFIGCARNHSEYLVSGEGCPPDKVYTVPNGVDVARFRPGDREVARARLGIPLHVPVVGIVAALRPEKQHLLLLDSFADLLRQGGDPETRLLIVGDGPQREAVEQRVHALGLGQQVDMLGLRQDIPEILAAMDVKVLASKMEANPASTLEAAACGLPVVAPRVGSLPETVQHNTTGLLVPPDDGPALTAAIHRVLAAPEWAQSLGQAGRELVCRNFSRTAMVRGYEQLIEGILAAKLRGQRYLPGQFAADLEALGSAVTLSETDFAPIAVGR